ncbi:MAG: 16S rRNA (guanine(527)-N(7))-methyltransferase RsmG [Moraxella sp.]|nr:16S rRNA (guanine(527)-N(7))-methyltransferase RsmG [Moraxella sp.]
MNASTDLSLAMTDEQKWQLLGYLDCLLLWTKAYNLTAITEPKEALIKHVFDCLAVLPKLPFLDKTGVQVLDIGTGAGLPSVIIAIMRPDWQITALDSNGKKIRFIKQAVSELGISNVNPVASRIEQFDGAFELITSRAFASLVDFVDLASPYLADDGKLSAMKGKAPSSDELTAVQGVWQVDVKPLNVPLLPDERCLVELTKRID